MAEKYLELLVTPAVARAREHYFGRALETGGAPERDALTAEEQGFIAARDSI